jgi:hypothetical protein
MRASGTTFGVVAAFMFISDLVYWFTSHDPTGTTALAFAFGLSFLISYYLLFTARRIPPQVEDQPDSDIADGAGELGFFSPHSYWPFYMGVGTALFALGFVFGWWLAIIGVGIVLPATVGLLFEYYVHDFQSQAGRISPHEQAHGGH